MPFEKLRQTPATASTRERGRALMKAEVDRQGIKPAKGQADPASASAGSPARGPALMAAELRRQGIEPRR